MPPLLEDINQAHLFGFGLLVTSTMLLYVAKRFILVRLTRSALDESSRMPSATRILVRASDGPLSVVILCLFLWASALLAGWLLPHYPKAGTVLFQLFSAGVIVALFYFLERVTSLTLQRYQSRSSLLRNSSSITGGTIRVAFSILAILIILSSMGVSVTPIIASLGITSLAVALALQPTLENFFSGIQLVMDKPVRLGDFIELDSGEQGFVEKIGWRSTWIRMLPNNIVIMPNSKLSNSKLINYYYPEKELSVPVEVGVHYRSDLEKVEAVCLEVAEHILHHHHFGVPTYEPFVLFHTFDSSSINLTVMLRTREYFNRFFIKSAFIKLLKKRFDEEGIVIPFPIMAINTDQEPARHSVPEATQRS